MLPVLVAFLWRWLLIGAILIEDIEKVRNDAIIAIVYKQQGFSRKCRSCGSDVVRGFDDTVSDSNISFFLPPKRSGFYLGYASATSVSGR